MDPNVFIADSGSTTHATPVLIRMQNLDKAMPKDNIEMGNGNQENTKKSSVKMRPCASLLNSSPDHPEFWLVPLCMVRCSRDLPCAVYILYSLPAFKRLWAFTVRV
jgi:hypothetical protein